MTRNAMLEALLAVLEMPSTSTVAVFAPPAADEHDPYYGRYISRVPPGDFIATLRRQVGEVVSFLGALTPEQADFAYEPGKWTVKEVLGHFIDTERVFSYRAASIGRGDPSALPGFDQTVWAVAGEFGRRSIGELLTEWLAVRAATLVLVEGFPAEAPLRRGVASDKPISVRALLYIPPGHVDYHLDLLRERYVAAEGWPT